MIYAEEKLVEILTKERHNMLVPWVLILSYGYYIRHDSLVSDHTFDLMMKTLLDNFDEVKHVHKGLLTKGDLSAGTLYGLKHEDYPKIVVGAWYDVKYKNATRVAEKKGNRGKLLPEWYK